MFPSDAHSLEFSQCNVVVQTYGSDPALEKLTVAWVVN